MLAYLRKELAALGADAFLVSTPANVRYLTGFSAPEDGKVFICQESARLITDGRYIAQAQEESRLEVDIVESGAMWLEHLCEIAKPYKLAIEADHLTVEAHQRLQEALPNPPLATTGLVAQLRLIKTPDEANLMREAAHLTDAAFSYILNIIKPGLGEADIALELESYMRKNGAEGIAFPIIVASGVRSSMPHGTASSKKLATGELITLDFGARLNGYHSDMTRTVALGEVSDEQKRMYQAVLEAQTAVMAALAPEVDAQQLDLMARDILGRHELDSYYSHGLGHGVGLQIHEAPRLSYKVSSILKPGMTVTIEPGVYQPGIAGVRIEDFALITADGYELLSHSDKAFIQL